MENLKELRENLGLSRHDMGNILGVSIQTIWNLENRSYKKGPSPLVKEKIIALCDGLKEAKGSGDVTPE